MRNRRDPIEIDDDLKLHPSEILQAHKNGSYVEIWFTDHVNKTKNMVRVRDKYNRIWNKI